MAVWLDNAYLAWNLGGKDDLSRSFYKIVCYFLQTFYRKLNITFIFSFEYDHKRLLQNSHSFSSSDTRLYIITNSHPKHNYYTSNHTHNTHIHKHIYCLMKILRLHYMQHKKNALNHISDLCKSKDIHTLL